MTTKVLSKLAPKNDGPFPTHEDIHGEGGFQVRADSTDRDSIPTANRKEGMWVKLLSDGKVYTLTGGITNGDWVEVTFGGGGAVIFDGGTNPDNIRSNRPTLQSSIDNTKIGIVNLSSNTGAATGAVNDFATISGGDLHTASGSYSFIGGGQNNTVTGSYDTISGGITNQLLSTSYCTIGGGDTNVINTVYYSTIGGGQSNIVNGPCGFIGGGASNTITGQFTTIVGGSSNQATGTATFVGSGQLNQAINDYSVIVGGDTNLANANYSFIGGGSSNQATGDLSSVINGQNNVASGTNSVVVSGNTNQATGSESIVVGGNDNLSSGVAAFVGGGNHNQALGDNSSVAGGKNNIANAESATVLGYRAKANLPGQFAHSGGNQLNDDTGRNQFTRVVFYADSNSNVTVDFGDGLGSVNYPVESNRNYGMKIAVTASQVSGLLPEHKTFDLLVSVDNNGVVTVADVTASPAATPLVPTISIGAGTYVVGYTTTTNVFTLNFTGAAAVDVRATATIEATELLFGP